MANIQTEPILIKAEGKTPLQKTLLIVCEGKNTEVDYFDKFQIPGITYIFVHAILRRASDGCSNPLQRYNLFLIYANLIIFARRIYVILSLRRHEKSYYNVK